MTLKTTTIYAISFKTERDIILVDILSALLVVVIAFFQNSPARIILGLLFILFFSGYVLISALFPRKEDLDGVERLALSLGLSIAVTSLIGLVLNYTPFGIGLYSVTFSLFSFILLMSAVTVYRRRNIPPREVFAPLTSISIFGLRGLGTVKNEFMKLSNGNILIKIIAIIAFIFITLALSIVAKTPPASGYEISIYEAYPWYFWVFIITSIFMGQIILLKSAISSDKNDKLWVFGFLAILTTNIILLFMPFIRGYATYGREDVLTHIGLIKDIFRTTSIGTFYPLDHILTASLSYITSINVEHAVNIIPPIFSLFYIISIYFLARQIFERKDEVLFVLAFTSILLFSNANLIFAPSVQSFFLLPFVLYLYFKSRNSRKPLEFGILLIISLFFIVFFHPMSTLFLITIFLILEFCLFIYKDINKKQGFELLKLQKRGSFNVILISFITFFIWYFSFSAITGMFRVVLNWLLYEIGKSELERYSELIARTHAEFFDLIEVILNKYGQIIILGFLSFIFSIYIFNIWRRHTGEQKLKFYHIFFSTGSLIFVVLSIIFFFNDFIIGFGRVSKYTFFFSSVFVALSFYLLFRKSTFSFNKQRFKSISLCVILILLLYFSTFNLYYSPITKLSNQQVSEMEINSMTWFFDHRNEKMLILEIGLSQKRFHNAIFGSFGSAVPSKSTIPAKNIRYGEVARPVDHFGYINKTSFGDYYEDQIYLLISILGRISYPELHPKYEEHWRFTADDFCMLEKDNTVLRIYDNGNVNIYFVD